MHPKNESQGWLTFAQNSETTNYVDMAYLLALSVKATCKINSFAVAVDKDSEATLTDNQRKVFDHVIVVPKSEPFENESLAWEITPYKETFKLEADVIIPRNIDHWWDGCRVQDVVYTTNVRDYKGQISNDRTYRKFFDANNLVNSYNGFTYFRHSRTSAEFFGTVEKAWREFHTLRDRVLKHSIYDKPDTDVLWALASLLTDNVHHSPLSYPTFTHMKGAINGFPKDWDWRNAVAWTNTDDLDLIVGGYAQNYPFHYFQKDFCTKELIERYEQSIF